jgi:hypothetical protein
MGRGRGIGWIKSGVRCFDLIWFFFFWRYPCDSFLFWGLAWVLMWGMALVFGSVGSICVYDGLDGSNLNSFLIRG